MVLVKKSSRVHNRIMKHTYSFLSGVGLVSLCVVATGSLPGYMFLVGFATCLLTTLLLGRAIGVSRIARFFYNWSERSNIRLSSHWNSDDKRTPSVPQESGDIRGTSPLATNVPRRREIGQAERRPTNVIEPRIRRSAAKNATSRQNVVQSSSVLPQTQQDVLSALVNLKVSFADAEQAVLGAAQRNAGASFDEMFRIALALVQAGKSRRVA